MSMREARVPWSQVFGNDRPVEVEIGPGRGELLLAYAAAAPSSNFFAIERAARAAAAIMEKVAARRLANLRVVAGDARCIIARLVPDASVAAHHVYFPDPWPKPRHRVRRLTAPRVIGHPRCQESPQSIDGGSGSAARRRQPCTGAGCNAQPVRPLRAA